MISDKYIKFINLFQTTFSLFNSYEKRQFVIYSILLTISSILEIISLIAIIPLIKIIIEPTLFVKNQYFIQVMELVGPVSLEKITIFIAIGSCLTLLISFSGTVFIQYKVKVFTAKCQNRLSRVLLKKLISLPYSKFIGVDSTENSYHIFNDLIIWGNTINLFTQVFSATVFLIVALITLLIASPMSGIVIIILGSMITILILYLFGKIIRRFSKFRKTASAQSVSTISSTFSGMKEILVNKKEQFFLNKFFGKFDNIGFTDANLRLAQNIPPYMILFLGQFAILLIALNMWSNKIPSNEIASQIAFILLVISRIIPTTNRLVANFTSIMQAQPHIEYLIETEKEFLNFETQKNISIPKEKYIVKKWDQFLLKNVSFRYSKSEEYSLKNISITIKSGDKVGIVGLSGAGKSTLMDVMIGLLRPSSGKIMIDKKNFNVIDENSWKSKIGYVPQNPFFVKGTILQNIAFGLDNKKIDTGLVKSCLKIVNMTNFINKLPKGLNTNVGEMGANLSGGEKQRLAIARALYTEPEILFLDEATSSLDKKNEKIIKNIVSKIDNRITVIIITHSISIIESCDNIYLIDKGHVLIKGKHKSLMIKNKLYRDLAAN